MNKTHVTVIMMFLLFLTSCSENPDVEIKKVIKSPHEIINKICARDVFKKNNEIMNFCNKYLNEKPEVKSCISKDFAKIIENSTTKCETEIKLGNFDGDCLILGSLFEEYTPLLFKKNQAGYYGVKENISLHENCSMDEIHKLNRVINNALPAQGEYTHELGRQLYDLIARDNAR